VSYKDYLLADLILPVLELSLYGNIVINRTTGCCNGVIPPSYVPGDTPLPIGDDEVRADIPVICLDLFIGKCSH